MTLETPYDSYWQKRVEDGRTGRTAIHRRVERIIRERVPENSSILDCGVGPGHYFRALKKNYRMAGVEISPVAVARLEFDVSRIKLADLNFGIPDFGEKFDCVIGSMILHHLIEPDRLVRSVHATLRAGGYFIVAHPNLQFYKTLVSIHRTGKSKHITPDHKIFLQPHDLERLLKETGFSLAAITSPKRKPFPKIFSRDLIYVCKK